MTRKVLSLGVALLLVAAGASAAEWQRGKVSTVKGKSADQKATRPLGTVGKLSPVQQKLVADPDLERRVGERLPTRIDVVAAASGFRNLGQFVAAVNAARNLQIPFVTLKARMVDDGMSLGQAIRKLRPAADVRKQVDLAERQAKGILKGR